MTFVLAWFVCAIAALTIARRKGYPVWIWTIAGTIFGIFALIAALVMPDKKLPVGTTSPLGSGLGIYAAGSVANGRSDPPMTSHD